MKIVKMSLIAAVLVGSSAFAISNVKVSGDAQLVYSTNDSGTGNSVFDKASSAGDTALHLNGSADLVKNSIVSVSTGVGFTAESALGLENNLVNNTFGGAHTTTGENKSAFGAHVNNASWFNEAWIAGTIGKTTVKAGRMKLDTPLAFTETWSTEENTFEGAVVINTDIPGTTLVGAYVGNGNGTEKFDTNATSGLGAGAVVNKNGEFTTYGTNGAYAVGAINNSYKPLTVQAWYYDLKHLATAYWLEADFSMKGIMAGAQYANEKVDSEYAGASTKADDVYALMLGYEMKGLFTAKVAYSSTNDNGTLGAVGDKIGANTATSSGDSKLYTEAWWNYGYVTQTDTNSYNITVTSPLQGIADLGLYYTNADQGTAGNAATNGNNDMTEFTATVGKKFGPLDATLAYINTKAKDQNNNKAYNMIQAYLTLNF